MIRALLLLAVGSVNGGCSAGPSAVNAVAGGDREVANGAVRAGAQGRVVDRGAEATVVQERLLISSDQGRFTAELVDNDAAKALVRMLPLTIQMRDHLRQEKTGTLPSALPSRERQTDFSVGMLGLWGDRDLVIYYRNGRVPLPGVVVLGRVTGDLSVLDHTDTITVTAERID